mgnify:FL=1
MSTETPTGLEVKDSMYAFVASKPRLTYTENGDPRLYFKAGQRHRHYDPDNGWTNSPTTFHDVVAYKGAAKFGIENLREKDRFMAQGTVAPYVNKRTGEAEEQFEASRFLIARATPNTTTGRAPARNLGHDAQAQDATGRAAAGPERAEPARPAGRGLPQFDNSGPRQQQASGHSMGL